MSLMLSCSQGHQWESFAEGAAGGERCPFCGAPGTSVDSLDEPSDTLRVNDELPPLPRAVPKPDRVPKPLPTFAGYELLEELGRGGMGVVYKARQVSLDRLVALKVIASDAHAGVQELARFRTEVEAVARLQHPNIVQVHEVGEHDGRPFYSMELVSGGSLDHLVNGTPLSPDRAATLAATLAQTMYFVHAHGIVHRDLKPANVLLSAEGGARSAEDATAPGAPCSALDGLVPKITDFGLAKRLDRDSGHTQSGAILGTPSYMAPEQARAEANAVGPLSDVYALGAILYEMLTGRPPFKGETLLETVRQVLHEEPVPPARLQPKLPRDLETICLRCLQKDPRRRYPSALALADDLGRFLRGEPVLARPVGPVERLAKWARRRPAVASLIGVVLVAALALAGTGVGAYLKVSFERDAADYQRQRAQRGGDRTLRAVRQIIDVSQKRLQHVPHMEQHRRAMLEEATRLYDDLLADDPTNPEVRRDAARAYHFLGDTLDLLDETEAAASYDRRAFELRQGLVDEFPGDPKYQHDLSLSYRSRGWFHHQAGRPREAEADFGRALALMETLPADNREYRHDLGSVHYALGIALWTAGRHDEAEGHQRRGLDIWNKLVNESPEDSESWDDLGASHLSLGSVLRDTGRLKEAEAEYREALACKGRVKDPDFRARFVYQTEVARIHHNLAGLLARTGRLDDAEAEHREAVAAYRKVAEDYPTVPVFRLELASGQMSLGRHYRQTHKADQAAESFHQAQEVWARLAEEFAGTDRYQKELAGTHENLGSLYAETGRPAEATESYRRAIEVWAKLAARHPGVPEYRQRQATAEVGLGDALGDLGRLDEAREAEHRALDLRRRLASDSPGNPGYQHDLANSHDALGQLARQRHQLDEAEKAHREALGVREKLARDLPADTNYQAGLAHSKHSLGLLLLEAGRLDSAEELLREALAVFTALAEKRPDDPDHRRNLAAACTSLGNLLRETKRPEEAERLQEQALGHREKLARDYPQVPLYRQLLAHAHFNAALLFLETGSKEKAQEPLQQAIDLLEALCKDFPRHPDYRFDLGGVYNTQGNLFRATERFKKAEQAWGKAVGLQKQLSLDFPGDPRYRYELAMSHCNRALLLHHNLRRTGDAAAACGEARALLAELVREYPDVPTYHHLGAGNLKTLALIADQRGQGAEARRHLAEAIDEERAALKPYPAHPAYRQSLREQYEALGAALVQAGEHREAAKLADGILQHAADSWEDRLLAGRLLARCVPLLAKDKDLNAGQREELTRDYTDRAVEALRAARAKGWKDTADLTSRDFDPLRKHKDFEALWKE